MEYEQELLPMIKEKCIRNKQDVFIENALHFFMMSNNNCCDWIMETYSQFQSEYLKSMFCLVLGFRGDESMIPFLIEEASKDFFCARCKKNKKSKNSVRFPISFVLDCVWQILHIPARL